MGSLGCSLIRVSILLGILASCLILVISGIVFFSELNSNNYSLKLICIFTLSISFYSIYRLNKLDGKRQLLNEKKSLELIRSEIENTVFNDNEYIFNASLLFYLVLFTFAPAFIVGGGFLGYMLLASHKSIFATAFGLLSTYSAILLAYIFYKSLLGLIKFPLLRINHEGIHHFSEGKVFWEDISSVSLMVTEIRNVKRRQLILFVLDKEKYASRINFLDRWLLFVKNKNMILMGLPVNEKTARTIEIIAQKFAAKYALNSVHHMEILHEELGKIKKDNLSEKSLNRVETIIEEIAKIKPPV